MKKLVVLSIIALLLFSFPLNVDAQPKKRVLIDVAHDEPINFTAGYNMFFSQLTNKGFTLAENKLPITENTLRNYDILLIIVPKSNFTAQEIYAIEKFVRDGGSLLLIGRGGSSLDIKKTREVLNQLTVNMGITFNDDLVTDTQSFYDGDATNVIVVNMIEDPITKDVYRVAMKLPCSLFLTQNTKALMRGSPQSLSRPYLSDPDKSGTLPKDPLNTISGTEIILAARSNVVGGKVVAMGSSTFIEDHMITKYDHMRLISNIFDYLSETESVAPPEEKELTYSELILAAEDYLKNNNYDDAIKSSDKAIALDASKYEPYLIKAKSLWNKRKYNDALTEINNALDRNPGYQERMEALVLKGDILISLGKYEEALSNFNIAKGLNDRLFGAWYGISRAQYNLGNYQESIEAINSALEIAPTNADANAFKSMLVAMGDDIRLEEAARYFKSAEDSYLAGDFKKARDNYVQSKKLYTELGDQEKVRLIDSKISAIDSMAMSKNSIIFILGILFVLGIGLVVLLLYLIKPEIFKKT
ncbi:MAG: Tetratricopeptide repeat protein [Candidatus Methanofastidiosum methylothiophilum]|uniref:Tetratricopeptide repeat protein n=1 Tax=Candidatus Methanofastidiosum methylothiophilum TaxID=1705564 RepID=A0A150IRF3_9EURY|nr:MAG: Tetratricopeptide repeat protein [Candidatus Methanofastidiosum methylthiophilus]KYC47563.1 MAG: Tetratricopeptide repeat protein [Candidatus Methanofastidiosum methylthiophilus]KYC50169.1 MAG: Tetratricopeptide repeat protein [Candidatus Methanofastidiosum methylthiophilus]